MVPLRGDYDLRDRDAFRAGQGVLLFLRERINTGRAGGEGEDHYEFGRHVQSPVVGGCTVGTGAASGERPATGRGESGTNCTGEGQAAAVLHPASLEEFVQG